VPDSVAGDREVCAGNHSQAHGSPPQRLLLSGFCMTCFKFLTATMFSLVGGRL